MYDKIKPLLRSATASFGITALNELQQLYNKKYILTVLMFCAVCRILDNNVPVSIICTAVLTMLAAYVDQLMGTK